MLIVEQEEMIQVIKDTILEMKKNHEEVPKNFYFKDEMSLKYRKKLDDHYVRFVSNSVLAVLDTSFFKNGSEGFVFCNDSLFSSDKYFTDVNNQWRPLREIAFRKLSYIEIYPDNPRFCYLAFKDGHAIKACNEKYNVFIVKILNAILNLYECKSMSFDYIKTIEEKHLPLHLNDQEDDILNQIQLYFMSVNNIYTSFNKNYLSKTRMPLFKETYLDKLFKEEDSLDFMVAIRLLEDGFDTFLYEAFSNKSELDNGRILKDLGDIYKGVNTVDSLEQASLCFLKAFTYCEMDSLEYLIETILDLFKFYDVKIKFELLKNLSELFDLMIDNNYPFKTDLSVLKEKFYNLYCKLDLMNDEQHELFMKRRKYQ